LTGRCLIDCIRDLPVVRDVIRPSLFNQGLKLGESKSSRSFDARVRLSASYFLVGMNACMSFSFCEIGNIKDMPQGVKFTLGKLREFFVIWRVVNN